MRILIPTDNSTCSREAIRFVGERAKFMPEKPVVELLNVQSAIPEGAMERFGLEAVRAVYTAEGQAQLTESEKTAKRAGLAVSTKVAFGEPGPSVAREADAFKAGLIAMGSRGLSPAKSFFLGSVSRSVLEHTTLPVLLVREEGLPERENLRVTLAVDGSEYGVRAAEFIAANPGIFGPKPAVDVLSIAPDYVQLAKNEVDGVAPGAARDYLARESENVWEHAVTPACRVLDAAGIEVKPVNRQGTPSDEIAHYAEENSDIIVMGSHGYGRFKSAVLGSTAARVGATTKLPIVVIRLPQDNK